MQMKIVFIIKQKQLEKERNMIKIGPSSKNKATFDLRGKHLLSRSRSLTGISIGFFGVNDLILWSIWLHHISIKVK